MAGKYGEARAVAKRGVGLNPTNQPALLSLGLFTYMDGDRAEALALLRRARQLNPATFEAWWELFRPSPQAKKLFEDKDFERQLFQ
jgi:Flp pilus assembly protein TadD